MAKRDDKGRFSSDKAEKVERVIVFPRGQISPEDKAQMLEHFGTLCIEADDPKAVVQLNMRAPMVLESSLVSGDVVLTSLLRALADRPPTTGNIYNEITSSGRACHEFVRLLADAIAPKKSA